MEATEREGGLSLPRVLLPQWVAAGLVAPVLVLGQRVGFVADHRVVVLLGSLLGATLVTSLVHTVVFPHGGTERQTFCRLLIACFVSGWLMYLIGWGAVLTLGFVFVAVEEIRNEGSRVARPTMLLTVFTVALGELAVAGEWVDTLLPQPQSHGLALLTTMCACFIMNALAVTYKEREGIADSLRHSESRLSALVEHATDAILVIRADGSVVYASPASRRILGKDRGPIDRLIGGDFVHPEYLAEARDFFRALILQPDAVAWTELPLRHADGSYRWFEIGASNRLDDPSVGGVVCNMRDITDRRVAEQQLKFQAYHDELTKLPNRWLFVQSLESALADARKREHEVAVLFLDVDRFKLVNDSLGHEIGDRLLVELSERLCAHVRPGDLVARFGGDEFTIMLSHITDVADVLAVADRVTSQLQTPIVVGEQEMFVSSSIGISVSTGGAEGAGELLRQADLAMYAAKEKGRSRWELFDPSSSPEVVERLELEGDLWRAVENGELRVVFQPEVELRSGRVIATEALVRWEHPRRGLIEPDRFVPFAEESSLIVAIDRYVLGEACRWARKWSAARPRGSNERLVVSVNLSPRFMRQPDVVAIVTDVLRSTGVDPRCIQIEITERTAITDIETTCMQLHQLRALGVRVAIDDFGTGYSSLSYLKQLPIDVLKLDRAFLATIDTVAADVAIVQAVVTMGHALGIKVTAEGVERPEQATRLRELGCDSAMGWLWSRAVPPEEFAARATAGFDPAGPHPESAVVLSMRRA